jgi:hypothetical protein
MFMLAFKLVVGWVIYVLVSKMMFMLACELVMGWVIWG